MDARKNALLIRAVVSLAVTVAVAAIAVPAWRTHTVQSHITEALKAADGAKLVVMEAATTRGGLDRLTASDLVYNGDTANSPYVSRITLSAGGRIRVATRNTGASPDPVFELVPAEAASAQGPAPIAWGCVVVSGGADAMPEDCRAAPAEAAGGPVPAASVGP